MATSQPQYDQPDPQSPRRESFPAAQSSDYLQSPAYVVGTPPPNRPKLRWWIAGGIGAVLLLCVMLAVAGGSVWPAPHPRRCGSHTGCH